jgi:hypothetical protein
LRKIAKNKKSRKIAKNRKQAEKIDLIMGAGWRKIGMMRGAWKK